MAQKYRVSRSPKRKKLEKLDPSFNFRTSPLRQVWWSGRQEQPQKGGKNHFDTSNNTGDSPLSLSSGLYAHNPEAFDFLNGKGNNDELSIPLIQQAEVVEVIGRYRNFEQANMYEDVYDDYFQDCHLTDSDQMGVEAYTAIPVKRLAKLKRLEKYLREERKRFEKQCTWAFHDTSVSARLPIKFVVIAVNNVFDNEIQSIFKRIDYNGRKKYVPLCKLAQKIENSTWRINSESLTSTKKGAHKLKDFCSEKHKLVLAREKLEMDREVFLMNIEDTIGKDLEELSLAKNRKADYCIYISLAIRYGPLTESKFNSTIFPGKLFSTSLCLSAKKIQTMWRTHYPIRLGMKNRSATLIQKIFKGFYVSKKYEKIFHFKRRIQKHIRISCLLEWNSYVARVKSGKSILKRILQSELSKMFSQWKIELAYIKSQKEEKIKRFIKRILWGSVLQILFRWKSYSDQNKKIKELMNSILSRGAKACFMTWRQNSTEQKLNRNIFEAAQMIQKTWRGKFRRQKYYLKLSKYCSACVRISKRFRGIQDRLRIKVLIYKRDSTIESNITKFIAMKTKLLKEVPKVVEELRLEKEKIAINASQTEYLNAKKSKKTIQFLSKLKKARLIEVELMNVAQKALLDFRKIYPCLIECINPKDRFSSFCSTEEYVLHVCPEQPSDSQAFLLEVIQFHCCIISSQKKFEFFLFPYLREFPDSQRRIQTYKSILASLEGNISWSNREDRWSRLVNFVKTCYKPFCASTYGKNFISFQENLIKLKPKIISNLHRTMYIQAKMDSSIRWANLYYRKILHHRQRDAKKYLVTKASLSINYICMKRRARFLLQQAVVRSELLYFGKKARNCGEDKKIPSRDYLEGIGKKSCYFLKKRKQAKKNLISIYRQVILTDSLQKELEIFSRMAYIVYTIEHSAFFSQTKLHCVAFLSEKANTAKYLLAEKQDAVNYLKSVTSKGNN